MKRVFNYLALIFVATMLFLTVKGLPGNPSAQELGLAKWQDAGPFELSPERGRFTLTYSVVEDKTLRFSLPLARFSTPDVGYVNGHYASLFAPAISFLVIPGYLIGKMFGASQLGSFLVISLFALLNFFLIKEISRLLGANIWASFLSALVFLFATPALTHAGSLYQHHVSVFLILMSMYLLIRFPSLKPLPLVGLLLGLALPVDNPDLLLLSPILVPTLKRIFEFNSLTKKINVKLLGILSLVVAVIPLSLFLLFNQLSHGNALKLSGELKAAQKIDQSGKPELIVKVTDPNEKQDEALITQKKKTASAFFQTRNILNGLYVDFVSPDRGILYFTPVMILALLGFWELRKRNPAWAGVVLGVLGVNLVLYTMWGDPWGGWAFGGRYLIPSYAMASILIAFFLTRFRRNIFLLPLFAILLSFSVFVNVLGAVTTNRIPPEGEAKYLQTITGRVEKYSFDRNYETLLANSSKSFAYRVWFSNLISLRDYHLYLTISLLGFALIVFILFLKSGRSESD